MHFDLLLAGGGLSAGLIALALKQTRPELRVAIVEEGAAFGGNHIWSCFESDLSERGRELAAPLVACRWPQYSVRFPGFTRALRSSYQSVTSERLHDALMLALNDGARFLSARIVEIAPDHVLLADGRRLEAGAVIDARGERRSPYLQLGFQKFLGLEIELKQPHALDGPVIMDATVHQHDGYRFVYVLPFSPRLLLVEDTYYADGPALDPRLLERRILDYVQRQGWEVGRIVRREDGVLPIALGGDIDKYLAHFPAGLPPVGLAAGLFHPVTGYSFPDAVRLALHIARLPDLSSSAIDRELRAWAAARWRERGFYRLLNRMLFRAARPGERWRVLERFYRLDEGLVARFYAARNTRWDMARLLWGKPPVPLLRAARAAIS